MIGTLSRRERTIVLIGGIALVVVLGWVFVVEPLMERMRTTTELVPSRAQVLSRRLDLISRREAIVKELEATNADIERAAILDNSPMIERVGPDDRAHDLGPAGANQPGDAENLAGAQRKAHVFENASPRQPVHGKNGVAARVNASWE